MIAVARETGCCLVCGHEALEAVNEVVLGRHRTRRLQCHHCGFQWFDGSERWMAEAYGDPIASTDTGIVMRSLRVHRLVSTLLALRWRPGPVLDWGSGSGLLVRLLRDDGHDCHGFEPHTQPILAAGFTASDPPAATPQRRYRAIVAIEVVEHIADPLAFFETVLQLSDTVLFSTELLDRNQQGDQWWYYSLETGQHISFFTAQSLRAIAALHGCQYSAACGQSLHLISRNRGDGLAFRWLTGPRRSRLFYPISRVFSRLQGRRSLVMADHHAAQQALRQRQQESRR